MPYLTTILRNKRRYQTGIPQLLLLDAGWREGQTLIWRVFRDGRAVVRPFPTRRKRGNPGANHPTG